MDSGECAVAPSTPKPPARLTAATTSRQWLKANSGNSIPSISQIGDFMIVFTPDGSFGAARSAWDLSVAATLAHSGRGSQAGGSPASSTSQNMQFGTDVLSLALWPD